MELPAQLSGSGRLKICSSLKELRTFPKYFGEQMLEISLRNNITLGSIGEFEIHLHNDVTIWRAFIIQENIFYLKPLIDWGIGFKLNFFPESPGRYILALQWKRGNEETGWVRYPFEVNLTTIVDKTPQIITPAKDLQLWVPNGWEALSMTNYEQTVVDILHHTVRSGWIAYDVGANLGVYSVLLGQQVGPTGGIYSFEANPVCLEYLRSNLVLNQIENCEVYPCALLDNREDVKFTINYGTSAVGLTQRSLYYGAKIGHEVNVQGYPLDELVETYCLRKPDLIKMDIEGAEAFAIAGMLQTLIKYHPIILLEIHGYGAAEQTLPLLDQVGYRYHDFTKNKRYLNGSEFLKTFPDTVAQILCLP
jgi:FkbM family methyltransferase